MFVLIQNKFSTDMRQVLNLFYWWADIENSFHATFDHHDELSRMKEHNFLLLKFYLKLCPNFEGKSYFGLFGSVKGFNFSANLEND